MKVWDVCAKVKISMFAEFDIYIVTQRLTPAARLRVRSAERKVKLGLSVSVF